MLRLAVFALLCVAAQAVKVEEYTNENFIDHSDINIVPHKIARPDKSYVYMTCMKTPMPNEAICHLTMEIANKTSKHCYDIKLVEPATREISMIPDLMMLKRMGDHKVLFEWYSQDITNGYQYQYKKVSVITMDQCMVQHLEFPINKKDWTNHELVPYTDKFDVFVTSKALCGEFEHCIIKYNYNGEQVGTVMNFNTKWASVYALPMNYTDSEQGAYFAMAEWQPAGGIMHAVHVTPTGVEHELFTIPMKDVSSLKYMFGSNQHGYYGLCYYENPMDTKVHCIQYNMSQMMMDEIIDLEKGNKMIAMFNMHDGGMKMVYRGCNGMPECKTVHVKHVTVKGLVEKYYEITNVDYQCKSPSDELIVDHKEIEDMGCYYFSCALKLDNGNTSFKYMTKCAKKE